jgi:hypothetical protein
MPFRTCDHLKQDGIYCSSPALKDHNYCYFHLSQRGRALRAAQARRRGEAPTLNLPFPENMYAVQVGLHEVMQGIVSHTLDSKDAGLLLYALQQASTNLLQTPDWRGHCQPVEPEQPLLALDFPGFAEQYQLPNGIDLDQEPEAALAEAEAQNQSEAHATHGVPRSIGHPLADRAGAHDAESPFVGDRSEVGAPGAVGAQGGNDTPSPKQNPAAPSSAPAIGAQDGTPALPPSKRPRGARVPLEKELWEHDDPDAPFRAYTCDGRELTPEDAKRWYQRQMQDLQKFIRQGQESEDAA